MNNYSIVILDRRSGLHVTVVNRTVTANELQDAIIEELININAEYPLTYADEIVALIDHKDGKIGYRVDTIAERKEIDSHYIHVEKL